MNTAGKPLEGIEPATSEHGMDIFRVLLGISAEVCLISLFGSALFH